MNEMLQTLNQLCSFKSVTARTDDPEHPYGEETNKALKYMLDTCKGFGFRTVNLDNQIGYAEIGEGEELFGIHDKGPAVASVYAMKDLLDSGRKFTKRIRIIFGQTEEKGPWTDMEYYKEHEELPAMGITPDADFPALYGEKGIMHFTLSMPKDKAGFISVSGGQAANMVADEAKGSVKCGKIVRDFYEQGKASHGSTPQDGKNAISMLMAEVGDATDSCGMAKFYNKYIAFDVHGERFGLDFSDEESGRLTLNVGKIEMTEDTVDLKMDIRYPVTFSSEEVISKLEAVAKAEGLTFTLEEDKAPVYMDKNGPLITELVKVYKDITGRDDEAQVIGGGTYARAMPNIVAFGPMSREESVLSIRKRRGYCLMIICFSEKCMEKL